MKCIKILIAVLFIMIMTCTGCSSDKKISEKAKVYDLNVLADMFNADVWLSHDFLKEYQNKEIVVSGMVGPVQNYVEGYKFVSLWGGAHARGSRVKNKLVSALFALDDKLIEEMDIKEGDFLKIQARFTGLDQDSEVITLMFMNYISEIKHLQYMKSKSSISGIEKVGFGERIYYSDILMANLRLKPTHHMKDIYGKEIGISGQLFMSMGEKINVEGEICDKISMVCRGGEIVAVVRQEDLAKIGYPDYKDITNHFLSRDYFPMVILRGKPYELTKGDGLVFNDICTLNLGPVNELSKFKREHITRIELAKDYSESKYLPEICFYLSKERLAK